jgi:MFS family permease
MTRSVDDTRSGATLIDRYRAYRTRRFLKHERTWSNTLPRWRSRHRRRILVVGLALTFGLFLGVSVACAFGVEWAPLLWLLACLAFFPLWIALQIVSGRRGDAPQGALDEYEVAQRDSARSIGLSVTQYLVLIPVFYLIVGSVLTDGTDENMAYAGGLMVVSMLLIGGCTPAMILGWTRPDPLPED